MDEKRGGPIGEPKVEQHQLFKLLRISICPTQVLDTISLFNHVLRDLGGPTDLSYFFQGL